MNGQEVDLAKLNYENSIELLIEGQCYLLEDKLFGMITQIQEISWEATKGNNLPLIIQELIQLQQEFCVLTRELQRQLMSFDGSLELKEKKCG
ncbi:hypothetical protein RAC89_00930 [Paenibacillus sp. GD4]|uniref:hypothetical protein n=1 Tax=Paenibacillus sp. GD4 TaxID=3068890 RepID=UPI002796A46C|nr:hypothetical protein [Paenibacillus sp. GD4]MDQ1909063.1 hypothetical protein [Paenibacillus sp. GD4]